MKRMLAVVISLVLLLSTHHAIAQFRNTNYYPDSVHVEFTALKATAIIELRYIKNHMFIIDGIPGMINELNGYLEKSNADLTNPCRIEMSTKENGEKNIRILPGDSGGSNVTINGSQVTVSDPGWTVFIHSREANITLFVPRREDLKALANENFVAISNTLKEDMANNYMGRKRVEAGLRVLEGKVTVIAIDYPSALDQLSLYGATGAGIVRDQLYPELTAIIGISFSDHFNRERHKFEVIYNNMFIPARTENGYRTYVNSFLSLSWNVNLCLTCDHPRWATIGAGYLVHKSGDYFSGKTMKFFITTDPGNRKINIIPEYYLTDDFKKSSLGLRMTYTF